MVQQRKKLTSWIVGLWVMGLVVTAVLTALLHNYQQERLQNRFSSELQRVSDDITRRFQTPVYGLMGARGVYAASGAVNRQEFRHYVESRNLAAEFPGVRGMGFIERVQRSEVENFVLREQADGMPDFAVRSLGADRSDLYVIKFIEPLARNRSALGLDVGSEAVRREAAERAARSGQAALSGVIRLVQDNQSRPGFLMFVPVYRRGMPLNTPEERMAALHGLTYSPIVLEELLQPSLNLLRSSGLSIQVTDKPIAEGGKSLYETGPAASKSLLKAEVPFNTNGTSLFIRAQSTPALDASANTLLVYGMGAAGALLSTFVCWVLWLQATGRVRAEVRAQAMTLDLQKLAMVAEHTANAVVMTDASLRIIWVNDGFTRVCGYTLEDALGRTPGELLGSGMADPATLKKLKESSEQGVACRVEILNRAKDGHTYWLDTEVQPIRDSAGQLTGFIEIGLDVTQERETNQRLIRALSDSEAQKQQLDILARVARETTNAVILTDPEGLVEWVNEGFTRITGYTQEESLGRTPGSFLQCAETDPQTVVHIREALALRQPCKAEILNRGKDGRHYWLELEITPLFDGSGRHTGYMAIQSNVTDRHETLERLKGAVQENESLMKAINQGTIYSVADLQGNIVELNDEFVRISGYERNELIGSNHRLLRSGLQTDEFWTNAWATISSGQIWRGEVCNRRKDGQLYWVDSSIVPFVGLDGMVEKYISIRTDITEQKRTQIELESQRKRLNNILKGTQAGTWEWHVPSGHIIFNERWAEILGYTTEDLEPTTIDTWMSLVHPDDTGASNEAMRQHFNGKLDFYKAEFRMRHSSGQWIWVQARGQLASREPDGSPGWMYGTNIDITQQKTQADALLIAKDQAEQASLFKSQFLANMSHEIRTPMNAILGMLTLMQNTPLQPRQLDYVMKTEGAAKSLLGLLNDILDLSKVEAGKMTLDPQPFDLDQLMRDLSVIFSSSLGNKPVEVLFDIDPRVPRKLLGDCMRLQQILINLGGNAIKFTSHGEIVLQVRLESLAGDTPRQQARVHFSVKDSGIGIAPENQHKIFAGFTQAEASTTRRFGGTGLGLSICRRLIELMGGQLRLESVEGSGSTFSFNVTLPVLETASNASNGTSSTHDIVPWCVPGLAVLVVDDNPVARELLARMGESLGWQLDTADSGEAALARIASRNAQGQPYRAVLVDWQMPGLDGWQTSARIRSLIADASESSTTPVVMMVTAHGREMLAQQTTEVQNLIDGYLVKPVTASMLLDAMQVALQPKASNANVRSTAQVVQPLKGLRILLVEDNAINQQVAEELLSGQGAAVDIADNGLRGVEAVQAAMATGKPYNAVLMDMQMPVMDGLTAAGEIRERLGVRSLPIIAMTANAMASDREACLNAGMNDHIGKPFNLDQLIATLLQWTRGAAAAEASEAPEAPMPHATPEIALLNRNDALQRMGGSVSLLDRLSTQFLADLPSYMQTCEQTMLDEQREPTMRALHSLKGVAATIGADALAKAAGKAEQHARSGAMVNLAQLRQTAARTEQALLEIGVAAPLLSAIEEAADDPVQPVRDRLADPVLRRALQAPGLTDSVNSPAPLPDGIKAPGAPSSLPEAAHVGELTGVQVLVVDDTDFNLEIARRLLEHQGATVHTCGSGREALDFLGQPCAGLDLVLMDVQMPHMDGLEATRRIRSELGLTELPIVALTAGSLAEERDRALAAGMNDFLSKPLDLKDLVRMIRAQLERRGALNPLQTPVHQAEAVQGTWPVITGIETAEAQRCLGGDWKFFMSILKRFHREYDDLMTAPAMEPASHERAALAARLHKLRGSSGTVGAMGVHRLATELEDLLVSTGAQALPGLQALAGELTTLAESVKPLLAAEDAGGHSAKPQAAAPCLTDAELQELVNLLEASDLAALHRFDELQAAVIVKLGASAAEQLFSAVRSLEFDQAVRILGTIKHS